MVPFAISVIREVEKAAAAYISNNTEFITNNIVS